MLCFFHRFYEAPTKARHWIFGLINRVNPDRVLDAQREISNAITTAIITNEPTGELELLKSDIENLKSHISQ